MKPKKPKHEKQGTETLREKLAAVLTNYQLYFAGNPANVNPQKMKELEQLLSDTSGVPTKFKIISYDNWAYQGFFALLNQLDGLSYGKKSLAMPKWVSLDCGMLPSGFVGFTAPACHCPWSLLEKFDLPQNYVQDDCSMHDFAPVPVSEFCCIPTAQKGTWIGHTLASISNGKNLGLLSKIIGLALFDVETYFGVAQWNNTSLMTHTKIADLEIVCATSPAHSQPEETFVYTHAVPNDGKELLAKFGMTPVVKKPDFYLNTAEIHTNKKSFVKVPLDASKTKTPFLGILEIMQGQMADELKYNIIYPGMIFEWNKEGTPSKYPFIPLKVYTKEKGRGKNYSEGYFGSCSRFKIS